MSSHLGPRLQVILETRGIPQNQFADLAEIDRTLLSRYIAGKVRPSQEVLEKICRALPERIDRAELAIAHLRDETPPSAADLVRVLNLVTDPELRMQETPPVYGGKKLPKKAQHDFEYLQQLAQSNPDVIEWIRASVDVLKGR